MAFPTQNTLTQVADGLAVQISDDAGAVKFLVYDQLYNSTGFDGLKQPAIIKEIAVTKDQVDALITAIQTT